MDTIGYMNAFNKYGRYLLLAVAAINLVSIANAQAATNISSALGSLCLLSQTFLGAAVMVLVVLAGVTYAIGQILGAETRARATVWATAMLTGAIIGIIIYIVAPLIISALIGSGNGITVSTTNPCSGV
jgi:hypothetical protein